jgi:hypothetical protein
LPSYPGEFDPKVYVNWEMEVDKEFRKFELSEEQKVTIASMVFTNSALNFDEDITNMDTPTVVAYIQRSNYSLA